MLDGLARDEEEARRQLAAQGVGAVHPALRLVAIASPAVRLSSHLTQDGLARTVFL